MISQKEFDDLIDLIKFKTKKTEAEIATELGYQSNHISILRGRGVTEKFVSRIKEKYKDVIEGRKVTTPIADITGQLGAILARQRVQGYYQAVILSGVQKRPLMTVLEEMRKAEEDALRDQINIK